MNRRSSNVGTYVSIVQVKRNFFSLLFEEITLSKFCMLLAMKVASSLFLIFVFLWTSVVSKSIGQIEAPLMEPMRYKKWTKLEPSVRFLTNDEANERKPSRKAKHMFLCYEILFYNSNNK
uniref:Bm1163 n=2 Tax=Brugia malayi TaxID=6279 RepID=A0A0H5S3J0_BRUMA|nr:Bm1163 [Brugia malayi]